MSLYRRDSKYTVFVFCVLDCVVSFDDGIRGVVNRFILCLKLLNPFKIYQRDWVVDASWCEVCGKEVKG